MSYEALGRANHKDDLDLFQPDLIILDEGHRAKNPKAAVTKRIARFMNAHPMTPFIVLSPARSPGGPLRGYAHLLKWSLKAEHSSLPDHSPHGSLERLGRKSWTPARFSSGGSAPAVPGALALLCTPGGTDPARPNDRRA